MKCPDDVGGDSAARGLHVRFGEGSALGSFVMDSDGQFIKVDDVFSGMLGVRLDDLDGHDWMANLTPEDRASVSTAIQDGLAARKPFAVEFDGSIGDGAAIACCLRAAPIFNGEEFIGFAGTVEDLTERRQLELACEQARLQADEANLEKSRLLAQVGREFRTRLNTMLGFAQVLEMEAATDRQRDFVEKIRRAGSYLLSLIDGVVDLGKIESQTLDLRAEPVLLSTAIQEVTDAIKPLAHERAVRIDVGVDSLKGIYVAADRRRLRQVLITILENAVKYNKLEGTVKISGEVDLSGTYKLSISDTGVGIPADKVAKLFTPFERLGSDSSSDAGTGLSLAISSRLVNAMDGTLEVDSVEGTGSTFTLGLRCIDGTSAFKDDDETRLEQLYFDGEPAATKILLIEDDELNIRLIETIFQRHSSCKLQVAMTGVLGLELALTERPDVILLDVNLPDVSGTGLIEKLRAERSLTETAIIVISADAAEKQIKKFLDSGADQYLTKPIVVSELLRAIEAQLQPT
ncbi:MAG: response regulator [Armatimonadetes bacterium]|nr:response regulator [Armatimonadota bacterium]